MSQSKPQLIYFGDPMCSWCYGFSPEISKVKNNISQTIDFQLVMGGLRPYNKETMSDLGDFLKHHWEEVGERSGQPFKYEILKDLTFVYDTEPACRAVVLMRKLKPESEFAFFKKIQTSFYAKNNNTNLTETYASIAAEFGLDKKDFAEKFESQEAKNEVRNDFTFSKEIGVSSFPTLVLKKGEKYYLIAQGYSTSEKILENIKKAIATD